MIRGISRYILQLWGWTVRSSEISHPKCIIIGAPHTSNWDFPLALLALSAMGMKFSWIGKHTLFQPPFNFFFRSLGGIPVDRSTPLGFIEEMTSLFNSADEMRLAIAPEGTRAKTNHWKTGFYHIARMANVPVVLGYIDYKKKELGVGPLLFLSDNIAEDFAIIHKFYHDKTGKYPENQSTIRVRKRELERMLNQKHE